MEWQQVVNSVDEFVFQKTGEHLNSLQLAILKGVLNGDKYSAIAKQYGCTTGHAKDKGYELWKLLSKVFDQEVNKSNLIATVERLGFVNYQHHIVKNSVKISNINFCNNSETANLANRDRVAPESNDKNPKLEDNRVEQVLQENKFKAVDKLSQLGLTPEQIAESLDLPLPEVQNWIE
jgi:predicted transposase YdaD